MFAFELVDENNAIVTISFYLVTQLLFVSLEIGCKTNDKHQLSYTNLLGQLSPGQFAENRFDALLSNRNACYAGYIQHENLTD